MGAGGKGDENVKVQVSQLMRCEAVIDANVGKYLAGLEPVLIRRS